MLASTTGLSASTCWLRSSVAIASAMRPDRAWQLARPRYGSADGSAAAIAALKWRSASAVRPRPSNSSPSRSCIWPLRGSSRTMARSDASAASPWTSPDVMAAMRAASSRRSFGSGRRRGSMSLPGRSRAIPGARPRRHRWGRRPWAPKPGGEGGSSAPRCRRSSAKGVGADYPSRPASCGETAPTPRARSVRSAGSASVSYSSGRGAAIAFQRPSRMLRSELQPKSSSGRERLRVERPRGESLARHRRPEIDAVRVHRLRAEQARDRGDEVDQAHGVGDDTVAADAGAAEDQCDAQGRVVDEDAVPDLAVFTERLAVIAGDDDERLFGLRRRARRSSRPTARSAVAISAS